MTTESSHLLQRPDINEPSQDEQSQQGSSTCSCIRKHLCLPSKAAILIILWTAAVGAVYNFVLLMAIVFIIAIVPPDVNITLNEYVPYAILAIISMLYPLSGFIADVYYGRLRVAVISLCFILGILLFICFTEIIGFATNSLVYRDNSVWLVNHHEVILILAIVSLVAFIVSLAGYQANVIQLGLDQLFEAPSQYL